MDQPEWMAEAWQSLGTREAAGRRHSRAVLDFFRDAGRSDITRDEVPWCAAFVGACLERSGRTGTGSLLARSYLRWGEAISVPRLGAVVVLTRGADPGAGHVGFWCGETETAYLLLGGNQADAVTVQAFAKDRLLGLRWPEDVDAVPDLMGSPDPEIRTAPPAATGPTAPCPPRDDVEHAELRALTFAAALTHVLEMEGGFTDDPDDPGGPTNKGIILEVYSGYTGRPLNVFTRAERVAELRGIDDETVEAIYRERYWRPSRAPQMPAAVAFMHFDASVNQGLTGAARLLQQAARRQDGTLEIDGEIGPLTMAAVSAADEVRLVADYAEVRRAKYRSLHHFWKFGRGWLNRVDRTEERARRLIGSAMPKVAEHRNRKGRDMTTIDTTTETRKWWGSSMTIWGAMITALSTVVPILGPAIGIDVTPDVVRHAGEQMITVIQAIGGLAGTIMTIYGRARASQPLERRNVQLHL